MFIDKRIIELEIIRDNALAELKELKQKRAERDCDFAVGDIVVDRNGKRAKVVKVYAGYATPEINVCPFKKNGELGLRVHSVYRWEKWHKENIVGEPSKPL